jgi:hypothetical protein
MNLERFGWIFLILGVVVGNNFLNTTGSDSSESGVGPSPIMSPIDFDKVFGGSYNFSDVGILLFRPSEAEFKIDETHWHHYEWMKGLLHNVYLIRNKESLGDAMNHLIAMAKPDPTNAETHLTNVGSTIAPGRFLTKQPNYFLGITPVFKEDEKKIDKERRPYSIESGLAHSNCGPKTGKFERFFDKHIIVVKEEDLGEDLGPLAFKETIRRRIGEAIQSFTFFMKAANEIYEYLFFDLQDECYSLKTFPAYTCKRFDKEDHVVGCFANGYCRPTYKKTSGHLTQLMCDSGTARMFPDYVTSIETLMKIQADFINDLVKSPPTQYDWAKASWNARRWRAKSRGESFNENPPAYEQSAREIIIEHYEKLFQQIGTAIPEEIKQLFFRMPKFYFPDAREARRDPENPSCGVLSKDDLLLQVCPAYKQRPDLSVAPYTWGSVVLPVNVPHVHGEEHDYPDNDEIWDDLGGNVHQFVQMMAQ